MVEPAVRYTRGGDVEIAWTVTGSGPIDIVYVPGFISHLDLARDIPVFGTLWARLERIGRVLAFDKRGTGLSGRDVGFGSLAERADDIRLVMDAAGWNAAHLFGISEGGPLALLFAASYPERVQSVSLYGSFACLLPDEDPTSADFPLDTFLDWVEQHWGTGVVLGAFVHAPPSPSILEQLGRYERACASPHLVAQIQRHNIEIDARPLLPSVSCPALVVHRKGDPIVGIQRARELAHGLPHATMVELPGDMHCCWDAREWADALDAVEEFLTGAPAAHIDSDRALATILFTDIVDSTRSATEVGDRVWRDLLDRHDTASRRIVESYGGRVIKHTGDGTLGTFDSPARAVHCAEAIRDALARERIDIRSGLHTGEIERRNDDISGIAVHVAARIAALARPAEILTSRTVHDLVAGSDLRFEDRGFHQLKGIEAEWQLYAAQCVS